MVVIAGVDTVVIITGGDTVVAIPEDDTVESVKLAFSYSVVMQIIFVHVCTLIRT